jgi:phosphomannomutase
VRASNTQPVLVVRAEGTTPRGLELIKTTLTEVLRRFPEVGEIDWGETFTRAEER